MHRWLLLAAIPLAGCAEALGPAVAVNAASITVIGRTLPDAAVTLVTGRDCSIVNLDRREPYCLPAAEATPPPALCTRSLGAVDCWEPAQTGPMPLRTIAEGAAPRPAQSWAQRFLGVGG